MSSKQAKPKAAPEEVTAETSSLLERLEALIREVASLRYEEDEERFEDIVSELVNFGDTLRARLSTMVKSLSYQERRAGVEAMGRLGFDERIPLIRASLEDANWKVRRSAARAVAQNPFVEAFEPLLPLLEDTHRELRLSTMEALGKLGQVFPVGERARLPLEALLADSDWRIRQEAAVSLGHLGAAESFGALLMTVTDSDEDVRNACIESLHKTLDKVDREFVRQKLSAHSERERRVVLQQLQKEPKAERLRPLILELEQYVSSQIDIDELSQFGRVITSPKQLDELDQAFERDREVDDLWRLLRKEGNRSVVLVGETGVGKTAIIHALTRRIAQEDPSCAVLETSTPELMVGTKYIGEWETKLHDLVAKIKKPRQVYLYLTNINDLPAAGTTSSNKQNFVTLMAPYLRRADITIIGESTPEALRKGIEQDLSIKRLFQRLNIDAPDPPSVNRVVRRQLALLGERHRVTLRASSEVLEFLIDLSGTYYSTTAQPGRSVTVLKQVVDFMLEQREAAENEAASGKADNVEQDQTAQEDAAQGEAPAAEHAPLPVLTIHTEDVIKGLARFTGLPELLLNDKLPLRPAEVRRFFEHRVLGQPEAVDSIIDLITLIKAGLTDPSKPFGVFLFVGPTGVGKTELGKALAEFIFGSRERLLRFDLSEYRDFEAVDKLIGGSYRSQKEGRLTSTVREQPFSVILLDEIEKAHPNVFDLFLQVFDDGRLTDNKGRVADFRHTIIIMTSNLASAFSPGGPLGFGGDEGTSLASQKGILREVQRFFRPEFVNRIDRIVVFRPLDPDVMRKIARREMGKALMRSGLLRRRLVVDIDSSVVDYLMAQGFSRAFGARPLKRAVETQVLLPVAREIVQRGPGYGTELLRVSSLPDAEGNASRIAVYRASSEREARLSSVRQGLAPLLEGTPLAQLLGKPRTRRAARAQWSTASAALDAFLARKSLQELQSDIENIEAQITKITFWDDPVRARQMMGQLASVREVHSALRRLMYDRDALVQDLEAKRKVPLKDWDERKLSWLAELWIVQQLERDPLDVIEITSGGEPVSIDQLDPPSPSVLAKS